MIVLLLILILLAIILPGLVRFLVGIVLLIFGVGVLYLMIPEDIKIINHMLDKPASTTWEQVNPTPWQLVSPYRRSQP